MARISHSVRQARWSVRLVKATDADPSSQTSTAVRLPGAVASAQKRSTGVPSTSLSTESTPLRLVTATTVPPREASEWYAVRTVTSAPSPGARPDQDADV